MADARAILAQLSTGEASVNDLAAPFDMSLPAVSKHIKVLERAGLIEQGQRAQYRPCRLNAAPLEAVASWTEHYRPIWEQRFDQLDSYLQEVQARHRQHGDESNNPQSNTDQGKDNE